MSIIVGPKLNQHSVFRNFPQNQIIVSKTFSYIFFWMSLHSHDGRHSIMDEKAQRKNPTECWELPVEDFNATWRCHYDIQNDGGGYLKQDDDNHLMWWYVWSE